MQKVDKVSSELKITKIYRWQYAMWQSNMKKGKF